MNVDQVAQECMDLINEKIRNLKKLNILVMGKTGVGKSTLINSIFRGNLAETGLGRPITSEIRKIEKKDFPLAIYDTPGFELSDRQQNKVKDEIMNLILEGYRSDNVNDAIHCIWYCINVGSNRTFDESEIRWLKQLTEENKKTQVPILVVLTQAVPKSKALEMKHLVEKENLDIIKVIPVLAKDMVFDEDYTAKAYGLENLIEVMSEVLPQELQTTLQNLQKVSLESKKKASRAVIATAVASSFGEGFAPVPMADASLIVPTQIGMIAGITAIFGMDINKSLLTSFVSSTIGSAGATVLGRTVVSNIFKLLPAVGSVVGGAISGTTAGLITTALGEAYLKIIELVYKGDLSKEDMLSEEGRKTMKDLFRKELKLASKDKKALKEKRDEGER